MDYDNCRSLPAMFFEQAERLGEKPFLWAKHGGRYQPISWAAAARTPDGWRAGWHRSASAAAIGWRSLPKTGRNG